MLSEHLDVVVKSLSSESDMESPILMMGRENMKILASPGSESSGVSSLDADEAKVSNSNLMTLPLICGADHATQSGLLTIL